MEGLSEMARHHSAHERRQHLVLTVCALAVTAALALFLAAQPRDVGAQVDGGFVSGPAVADEEAEFLRLVNAARAERGIAPLADDPELRQVALPWTFQMARAGGISHNPNLASDADALRMSWQKLGENVGRGGAVRAIETAFENSPKHLENILDPTFSSAAMTIVKSGPVLYITQQFRQRQAAAPVTTRATARATGQAAAAPIATIPVATTPATAPVATTPALPSATTPALPAATTPVLPATAGTRVPVNRAVRTATTKRPARAARAARVATTRANTTRVNTTARPAPAPATTAPARVGRISV